MSVRNRLFVLIILAVSALGGLTVYWWYQEEGDLRGLSTDEYVLILGLDDFGESRRSDTIMVAKLEEGGVKLLSIPRDLRVEFPGGSSDKINAAYALGGPELTRQLVSELLGVPIHRHVVVDYQGFIGLIDAIGGVTVTVEKPMRYRDEKQGLYIDLPAGTQTLDGQKALDFWRYRDAETGEDLGRIRRQHEFIKALAAKLAQIRGASQTKQLVELVLRHVRTNLAPVDIYRLVERLQSLGPEDLHVATLPGRSELIDNTSYFLPYPIEMEALIAEFFHGQEVLTNSDVKVVVLNGHPDEKIRRQRPARRIFEFLKGQSFQVIAYWNADAFDYPQSYIINVSGDENKAERLLKTLKGVPISVVTPEEFSALTRELFGEERFEKIEKMLLTTAVEPSKRAVELNEVDLILILGGGFE